MKVLSNDKLPTNQQIHNEEYLYFSKNSIDAEMSDIEHRYPNTSREVSWKKAKKGSVGIPAIWQTLRHLGKYADVPAGIKAALKMNQKGGFDCPGCAWPDPDDERSSLGEFCENGIKALSEEATNQRADPAFFGKYSVQELSGWSEFELGKSGRITQALYLAEGDTHYKPIEWNQAFTIIANHLNNLDHPDEAIFYTSGRTSNEAAFLYGTLARAFGTNNLPDCSNMCHECSGYGLSRTLGIGKGAVTLDDIHSADVLLIIGQNPGTNHPRMMNALEKCKENGGRIIAINPLREAGLLHYTNPQRPRRIFGRGVNISDLYLQVKLNGDIALLKAIMILLLEKENEQPGIVDKEFIKTHTVHYDEFIDHLSQTDLDKCVVESGVALENIEKAVELISSSPRMVICWAMGITQHVNGVQNVQEIVNLLLLKGSVGIKGAGPCPVRGHSNVQGDRTMGICEKMPESFYQNLGKAFNITVPRNHGYATVPAINAMYEGKARVFIGMGGNFVSATPDTDYTAAALRKCDLTVHVSTKPNRSHLVHGKEALILPTLGRSEMDIQESGYQFVSVENSMGIVHSSKGILPPKSEFLKSEVKIIAGLGKALFEDRHDVQIHWDTLCSDYDRIREKIEEVIPGFDDYNERVRSGAGFYLPNGVKSRQFNTESGKATFTINPLPDQSLETDELMMTTIRAHDQYNTTLYGLNDRYRGIKDGREIVLMNQEDMRVRDITPGQKVEIASHYGDVRRVVVDFTAIPYDLPKGNVATYFPEANPLIPVQLVNPETLTPASKSVIVRVRAMRAES